MSVVAVRVKDNGDFDISSDSQWTRGMNKGTCEKRPKLWETNDMVIGAVGTASEINIMRLYSEITKPADTTERAVLDWIIGFNAFHKTKTDAAPENTEFILCFNKMVFAIAGLYFKPVLDYAAIGSGEDFALAALYLGKSTKEAVEVACNLTIYCCEPVITISK